jgi:hypothetical protein
MRKLACFLTLAFCSAACVASAHADEVFQYAGNPLSESSCDGVCAFQIDISTSDVFNGVISFATPLAPNLSDVEVASDVDSFNFGAAFGGSSFYGSLIVSTDQNGNLSAWTISINTLVGGGGILDPLSIANVISSAGDSQSESGSSFGYVPCYTIGCFPEGLSGAPSSTTTPSRAFSPCRTPPRRLSPPADCWSRPARFPWRHSCGASTS